MISFSFFYRFSYHPDGRVARGTAQIPVAINMMDMMDTEHDPLRHGEQCQSVQSREEEEAMRMI